jgi:Domain of unknown function (DUF5666)
VNRPTVLTLAAGIPVAVLLLAGCGGSSTPDSAAAAPVATPSATGGAPGGGSGGAGRGPAASGEIAAVSGRTLQVQNTSSQTAVTWSASTKFTRSVPATLAAGDCVTVTGTPGTGSAITATSVRVLSTGGTCTVTPRAFPSGGARRSGGGTPPSGAPGGGAGPSGAPGGGGRDFATAFGTVTSVSGSTVVLSGTLRSGGRFGRSPGATPSAAPTATPSATAVTVTLGSSASVLASAAATGADAKVGTCATATGKADSSGTVAATAIALSPKGANGCTTGRFGGFGGFGG